MVPFWMQVVWSDTTAKTRASAPEPAILKVSPTVGGAGCRFVPWSAATSTSMILPTVPFTTVPRLDGPLIVSGPVAGGGGRGVGVNVGDGVADGEGEGETDGVDEGDGVSEAAGVAVDGVGDGDEDSIGVGEGVGVVAVPVRFTV
jgi:hypothetical protein